MEELLKNIDKMKSLVIEYKNSIDWTHTKSKVIYEYQEYKCERYLHG